MRAIGLFVLIDQKKNIFASEARALAAIYKGLGEDAGMTCFARCRKCAEVKKLRKESSAPPYSLSHH